MITVGVWLAVAGFGLVGATWIGYPLAIAAVAALRRRDGAGEPPAAPGPPPTVTVVLATREEPAAVGARVDDLLRTAHPGDRLQVVVAVDAQAAPALLPVLRHDDPRVRLVAGDAPGGKTAALNAAVREATGEVLVLTDTHQRFAPDTIPRLVAALRRPRTGAVSGALLLPGDVTGERTPAERYWQYERWLRRNEARVHSTVGVTGAVYAMWRERWAPLPAGLILDDVYVPMRLVLDGWRVGFEPTATATDLRRTAPEQEFRRKVRTLTGNVQLCAWLPAVLSPVRNPIWLQFVWHKLCRLLTPWLLALGGVGVLLAAAGWVRAAPAAEWRPVAWAVAGTLAAAIVLVVGVPRLRARLATRLRWGVSLQWAVVVATWQGLRGRWDVWR